MRSVIDDLPPPRAAKSTGLGIDDLPPPPQDKASSAGSIGGAAQAGLEHFGNAASLGYLPQLQALAGKLIPDPGNDVNSKLRARGFQIDEKTPTYLQDRDTNIKRLAKQGEDYPVASGIGTVGGSLATGIAASGLTPINAATRMGRVVQAAKGGALIGGLSNPGDKEGEVDVAQPGDRIIGTIGGGLVGGLGQGAIEGASTVAKGITNLPQSMQAKAEERTFKASGAMLKDYRKAVKNGGPERIHEIGRFMMDNGLAKPGMSVSDTAEASGALKSKIGEALGDAYDRAASSLKGATVPGANLEPQKLADEFLNEYKAAQKGVPGGGSRIRSVQTVLDDLAQLPGDGGFKAVNNFRESLDKLVFAHDRTPGTLPETKQGLADLRSWLDQRVDGAISAVDRATGGQVSQELPGLNREYGLAKEVAKISEDQTLRQNAKNFFSPTDYASAATGAIGGAATGDNLHDKVRNAAIGATLGVVHKVGKTYGTPLVSSALDKTGKALARSPLQAAGTMAKPFLDSAEKSPVAGSLVAALRSKPAFDASEIRNIASEESEAKPPEKGADRWAATGIQKLAEHGRSLSNDQVQALMSSPKGQILLHQASDFKPGSKAMQNVYEQIQKELRKSS